MQAAQGPGAFEARIFGEHVPQCLHLDRLGRHWRALGIEPGQLQGSFDQTLHAVDLTAKAVAQRFKLVFGFARHPQPAQRRAQLMGQIAQQLLLYLHCTLQAFGHLVEGAAQFTEFIVAARHFGGQAGIELIGAPGLGLLAQLVEGHHQHAIQAHA